MTTRPTRLIQAFEFVGNLCLETAAFLKDTSDRNERSDPPRPVPPAPAPKPAPAGSKPGVGGSSPAPRSPTATGLNGVSLESRTWGASRTPKHGAAASLPERVEYDLDDHDRELVTKVRACCKTNRDWADVRTRLGAHRRLTRQQMAKVVADNTRNARS